MLQIEADFVNIKMEKLPTEEDIKNNIKIFNDIDKRNNFKFCMNEMIIDFLWKQEYILEPVLSFILVDSHIKNMFHIHVFWPYTYTSHSQRNLKLKLKLREYTPIVIYSSTHHDQPFCGPTTR